jgi:hypothetical protein
MTAAKKGQPADMICPAALPLVMPSYGSHFQIVE